MAQVASFPGDSSGASGASSDSEEESSSLASASSPAKLPDFVCQAAEDGDIETVNASAGGTYRAHLHEHRKQVLMLRCLATKGRATTTDPVMNFLEQLGDNGVIWTVLSFWPPPP